MRKALVLGLVLLAVLSGCSTYLDSANQDHESDELVQSVVDANRSEIDALYDRHRRALRNSSSYRLARVHYENGTAYRRTELRVNRTSQRAVHWERTPDRATDWSQTKFVNRSGSYVRATNDSSSYEYRVRTDSSYAFSGTDEWAAEVQLPLPGVVAGYDFEYSGHENGTYVFEANDLRPSAEGATVPWDRENVIDASARLVLDEQGYVRSYSSNVKLDRDGEGITSEFEFQATAVDQTSVATPGWVEEASAANQSAVKGTVLHEWDSE